MKIIIFTIIICSCIGCSGAQKALTTKEFPECSAIVEGTLHSRISYNGKVPAICVKRHSDPEIFHGEIVRMADKGVVFDPAREGPFYDPDSEFFPNVLIQWLVDKNGNVLMGELPKNKRLIWDMELELADPQHPDAKTTTILLQPNQKFSYCLNAGTYAVKKITYHSEGEFEDESEPPPAMTIRIEPDAVNYIGDLYLDVRPDTLPNVHKIPTSMVKRPGYSASSQLGLIGALMYATSKGDSPIHTLSVETDSAFSTAFKEPIKKSLIEIRDR